MRLIQLEYFIKIAECGSITKAAQELYISQPSLTKSIANLETEYDIQLLERTSKGVRLTEKGREFLEYAKDLINSRSVLEATFGKKTGKNPVQRLCVASQQLDFLYDSLDWIYKESGGSMNIIMEETDRGSIIERVEEGEADIGILVLSRDDSRFFDMSLKKKSLEIHELDTSRVYVCMSRESELCEKKIITTSDTAPYLHVALDMDEPTRRKMCLGEYKNSVDREQLIFCNTIGACLHFIRRTGALLYIPKWVLGLVDTEPDMHTAPLHMNDGSLWPLLNRLVWIKKENTELSILERRYVHLLQERFSTM